MFIVSLEFYDLLKNLYVNILNVYEFNVLKLIDNNTNKMYCLIQQKIDEIKNAMKMYFNI